MSVSYDYYKIFYYVGKYKSFSRAAAVMDSSQPNVTRAMNNLEAALECRLFYRTNRGVTLTKEGEALYQHVQSAHKQLQIGEAEMRSYKEMAQGYVSLGFSIGITELVLKDAILPILHRYNRRYPGVKLNFTNASTPQLISDISNNLIDLAVVTSVEEKRNSSEVVCLGTFQDILIAGPAYRKLAKRKLSLTQLQDQPLVSLWSGTETYDFYNGLFSSHGVPFEPEIEVATTNQVLSFVENDLGVGFLSGEFAREALEKGTICRLELKEKIPLRSVILLRSRDVALNNAASTLEQMIMEGI